MFWRAASLLDARFGGHFVFWGPQGPGMVLDGGPGELLAGSVSAFAEEPAADAVAAAAIGCISVYAEEAVQGFRANERD